MTALDLFVSSFIAEAAIAAHATEGRDPATGRSRFSQIGRARHRDYIRMLLTQIRIADVLTRVCVPSTVRVRS